MYVCDCVCAIVFVYCWEQAHVWIFDSGGLSCKLFVHIFFCLPSLGYFLCEISKQIARKRMYGVILYSFVCKKHTCVYVCLHYSQRRAVSCRKLFTWDSIVISSDYQFHNTSNVERKLFCRLMSKWACEREYESNKMVVEIFKMFEKTWKQQNNFYNETQGIKEGILKYVYEASNINMRK